MLMAVLFISNGISCLMHRLAKSCLALFVRILLCIRVLNVWTALFNINGKSYKYTVMSCAHTYNTGSIQEISAYL